MATRARKPSPAEGQANDPTYLQLAQTLAQQILTGQLDAGDRLPDERDLARQHRVSRFTVRNALEVLETQGLIQRVRRRGAFVTGEPSGKRWFSTASTILFVHVSATGQLPLPTDTFYGGIYSGAQRMARALSLPFKAEAVPGRLRVPLQQYRPPQPGQVGGVIVSGTFDEQYIRMYGSEGVPVVVADFWTSNPHADSVVFDLESEAAMALDHLAEKGHVRFGFCARGRKEHGSDLYEFDPDIWRMLDRLRQGAQQRRMDIRDPWIRLGSSSTVLPQATQEMLTSRERPTAVICFDSAAAIPMLRAIEKAELRCPQDVSVITRGDPEVAGRQMTCLASDPQEMGRMAVKLLLERIQGQRQHALRLALVSRLVLGDTTSFAPMDPR